jgi:hypothetical protein
MATVPVGAPPGLPALLRPGTGGSYGYWRETETHRTPGLDATSFVWSLSFTPESRGHQHLWACTCSAQCDKAHVPPDPQEPCHAAPGFCWQSGLLSGPCGHVCVSCLLSSVAGVCKEAKVLEAAPPGSCHDVRLTSAQLWAVTLSATSALTLSQALRTQGEQGRPVHKWLSLLLAGDRCAVWDHLELGLDSGFLSPAGHLDSSS